MNPVYLTFPTFAFIVALGLPRVCDGKINIFAIENHNGNNSTRTVVICGICRPGFQPAQMCGHREKKTVESVLPGDNVILSSCEPCSVGSFSDEHSPDLPCKKCKQCANAMTTKRKCTAFQDTLCEDPRTKKNLTTELLPRTFRPLFTTQGPQLKPFAESNQKQLQHWVIGLSSAACILILLASIFILFVRSGKIFRKRSRSEGITQSDTPNWQSEFVIIEPLHSKDFEIAEGDWRLDGDSSEFEDSYSAEPIGYMCNKSSSVKNADGCDHVPFIFPLTSDNEDVNIAVEKVSIHNPCSTIFIHGDIDQIGEKLSIQNIEKSNQSLESIHCIENPLEYIPEEKATKERASSHYHSTEGNMDAIVLQTSARIGPDGGQLKLEGTSVVVNIPKGTIIGDAKELFIKVYLGPPNDHEQLNKMGHTIDLPMIEMGPSGMHFNRPVEVVMKNSSLESEDSIEFEFADGSYNRTTVWKQALKANSQEEAKAMSIHHGPHVSYFVSHDCTYAYYMHFTLGRKRLKGMRKKWLEGIVYSDAQDSHNGSLKLAIVLYEPTVDGQTILQSAVNGMEKVALQKPIKVYKGEPIFVVMDNEKGNWQLEQGNKKQEASLEAFFDPKFLGKLTIVDFVIVNEQNPGGSFSCCFDVFQENSRHKMDLKVKINSRPVPRSLPSASSGYASEDDMNNARKVYVLNDDDFPKDNDYKYMEQLINQLSEKIGSNYQRFCRNLKIDPCEIGECRIDYGREGCKEVCYQILLKWLKNEVNDNTENFKSKMVGKLQSATDQTLPWLVIFPTVGAMKEIKLETTV